MPTELINLASTEQLTSSTALRLTFSQGSYPFFTDAQYKNQIDRIYEGLIEQRWTPISARPSASDGKPAVIDLRLYKNISAADFIDVMNDLAGFYVRVSRIEKMSAAAAAQSGSKAGADARDKVKAAQEAEDHENSLAGKIGDAVGLAKNVVIGLAVIAVIVLLVMYTPEIKAAAKRIRK